MCIAYPGQVVSVDSTGAIVETTGRRRRASILLVPDIAPGDWVTVAAGTIVERLSPEEAGQIASLLRDAEAADATTHPSSSHLPRPTTTRSP